MRSSRGLWSGAMLAAVALTATVFAAGTQAPAPTSPSQNASMTSGAFLFRTYCASCHGPSAQGDGPLAGSMRRKPPNLTEIAKRNQGTYPKDLVYRVIDGREKVRGHGGPDMPVWGDAFLRSVEGGGEESVSRRIQALVEYLEMIQARDAQ